MVDRFSNFAFNLNLRLYAMVSELSRDLQTFHPGDLHGRAVQVDPILPELKPPGTKRLKLKCDRRRSTFAFNSNLRR